MTNRRNLVLTTLVFLLGILCGMGLIVLRRKLIERSSVAAGWVNGQPISRKDLERGLLSDRRQRFFTLVEQKLLETQAKEKAVTVADQELTPPTHLTGLERVAWLDMERSRLLAKKLALSDVSENEKKQFYETFRDQLKSYEIRCFVFPSSHLKAVREGIKSGTSWEKLKAQFGSSEALLQNNLLLAAPDLRARFGPAMALATQSATPGRATGPVITPYGYICFDVTRVRQSYAECLPQIEDIIGNSRQLGLIFKLRTSAKVREGQLYWLSY